MKNKIYCRKPKCGTSPLRPTSPTARAAPKKEKAVRERCGTSSLHFVPLLVPRVLVHRLKTRLNLLRGLSNPAGHTELMERSAISIVCYTCKNSKMDYIYVLKTKLSIYVY